MIVRVRQTDECRARRHANAGAGGLDAYPQREGRARLLRGYRRAGLLIPEEWSEPTDVDDTQLATLRADPHVEIEEVTAA